MVGNRTGGITAKSVSEIRRAAQIVLMMIGAVCVAPAILLDDLTELFRSPSPQVHR